MKKIMVVDDDKLILTVCRDALQQAGLHSATADQKEPALKFLETQAGEVGKLFADTRMGKDPQAGVGLIQEVQMRWPHITCVLMSSEHRNLDQATMLGVEFLPKPFHVEEFMRLATAKVAPIAA